jgi:hypothetical protein
VESRERLKQPRVSLDHYCSEETPLHLRALVRIISCSKTCSIPEHAGTKCNEPRNRKPCVCHPSHDAGSFHIEPLAQAANTSSVDGSFFSSVGPPGGGSRLPISRCTDEREKTRTSA